jgi:hypothetical protein
MKEKFQAMFFGLGELETGDEILFTLKMGDVDDDTGLMLFPDVFRLSVNGVCDWKSEPWKLIRNEPILMVAFLHIFMDSDGKDRDLRDRFTDRAPLLWASGSMNINITTWGTQTLWPKMARDTPTCVSLSMFNRPDTHTTLVGMAALDNGKFGMWRAPLVQIGLYVDVDLLSEGLIPDRVEARSTYIGLHNTGKTLGLGFRIESDMDSSELIDKLIRSMDLEFWCEDIVDPSIPETHFRTLFPLFFNKGDRVMVLSDASRRLAVFVNDRPWNFKTDYTALLWTALFEGLLGRKSLLGEKRYDLVRQMDSVDILGTICADPDLSNHGYHDKEQ